MLHLLGQTSLWIDPLSILDPTVLAFSRPEPSPCPGLASHFVYGSLLPSAAILDLLTPGRKLSSALSLLSVPIAQPTHSPRGGVGAVLYAEADTYSKASRMGNDLHGAVTIRTEIFPHLLVKLAFRTTEYIRFYDLPASLGNINLATSSSYDRAKSPWGLKMFENVN